MALHVRLTTFLARPELRTQLRRARSARSESVSPSRLFSMARIARSRFPISAGSTSSHKVSRRAEYSMCPFDSQALTL
ncbi:hypothetical protein D9M69_717680 [compost metagenome]